MARPRKPLLSRDRIIEAAGALVDAEGLEAVSTRRLAAALGVSGPSLYNHFRTKDEILDAVADAVSARVDLSMFEAVGLAGGSGAEREGGAGGGPGGGGPEWRGALLAWAHSYRAALSDHPNIVPVLARGPGRRPAGLRVADAVYGAMTAAGWPPAQATRIGALMRYFILGSAVASFARGFVDDETAYDPSDYPHLGQAHRLAHRQREVDEGAFETGLTALLDGLAIQYEALGKSPEPDEPA
ncbi:MULTISPECIES: TetR/AcrR family transcriptional regulator [unclassified Streptomyces]|uniref:TetR/AcrR family transcriptional regulator n=1 Tax=unclassified Streptomyces TaxID=2593676 RepID=UPI000DC78958|nr:MULTISPECIES: TetR/AcrR family transcriptional regulator [unclassified Streptomyces]AWZ09294.1 TetR/AcrR family transcriptional regulator [Streptomyces sp. ICC4]AWZ17035.1 TetR/AcrR family transcriptional regulator [Streptomyces sp. ICC1]